MDDLRLQAVAARVVAWHNRHPLARRITAAQVKSIGYVAFGAGGHVAPAGPPPAPPETAAAPAPHPVEEDFAQAFAELAAQAAAEEQALAPVAGEAADAVRETPSDATPLPETPAAAADDLAFDIEVELTSDAAVEQPVAAEAEPPETRPTETQAAAPDATDAVATPPVDEAAAAPVEVVDVAVAAPGASAGTAEAVEVAEVADIAVATPPDPAPAAPPALSSLRDRALNRAQQAATPAAPQGALLADHRIAAPLAAAQEASAPEFSDGQNFMAPLSPREVARWVLRHGRALLQAPQDGPLRRVSGSVISGAAAADALYVMTAAIEGGATRSRVLVGAGDRAAVLGPRLLSRPRVIAAATGGALLLTGLGVLAGVLLRPTPSAHPAGAGHAAIAAAASAPASAAASAAASASVSASAPATGHPAPAAAVPSAASPSAHGPAHAPAEVPAAATQAHADAAAPPHELPAHAAPAQPSAAAQAAAPALVTTTERPVPAYAQKGVLPLPTRGPQLSDEAKAAARQAVADARAAAGTRPRAAAAEAAMPAPAPAPTATPPPAAARPVVPAGPVFAVSTRLLRTRAEAEQVKAAMAGLLVAAGGSGLSLEMLPEGDDWRVVAWPYTSPADAERARALLASRGMKVQAVEF